MEEELYKKYIMKFGAMQIQAQFIKVSRNIWKDNNKRLSISYLFCMSGRFIPPFVTQIPKRLLLNAITLRYYQFHLCPSVTSTFLRTYTAYYVKRVLVSYFKCTCPHYSHVIESRKHVYVHRIKKFSLKCTFIVFWWMS